jgi:diaminopimelate decarboxylase
VIDAGGGLGIRYVETDTAPTIHEFVRTIADRLERAWNLHALPQPRLVVEPGRSLVGEAGVTLYSVGVVKHTSATSAFVAVDGGMSDNPRPQLYEADFTAVLANRVDDAAAGVYAVCGKHCESGDVLVERAPLPEPHRGDLLAVPATGAYTLAMASNYNALPRPAAVLVADGSARVIRRRETVDDLLALEA